MRVYIAAIFFILISLSCYAEGKFVKLNPPSSEAGYLAYLLINENPFPSEKSYQSMEDSKRGMLQVLWVLNNRLNEIPSGYTQYQVANTKTQNVIDIITAEGQCEGFFKDRDGKPAYASRVKNRIDYLVRIANSGSKPGKFAELLNFARDLSEFYIRCLKINRPDIFRNVFLINKVRVTGRSYSWMTNRYYFSPGGNFISIPDSLDGSIAGNRFFTLKDKEQ